MSSIVKRSSTNCFPLTLCMRSSMITNVSFTSVKHDLNICRKALIKLYAWNFLSQRAKQVWLMSSIKPNNSLWRIHHDVTFQGQELFYKLTFSSTSRTCHKHTKGTMQFEDVIVHNRNIGAPNFLITYVTIMMTWN